jgi:Transposase IS66 family
LELGDLPRRRTASGKASGGRLQDRVHALVSKYADHLPLYRQAQIYARQGVTLDRSTLADWVGRAAFLLRPVHERLLAVLKTSTKLFADETTAPVLDPGRGRTKTGQLFAYARDDRPWGGTDPPGVAYVYAPDRKAARPIIHLDGFVGVLQVDGYVGYRTLAERNIVTLAFCWSHVRRRFYELAAAGPAPIAGDALQRIASLYEIEAEIRGRSADERRTVRQEKSRTILNDPGCEPSSPSSARKPSSQRRSAMRSHAGTGSAASSERDKSQLAQALTKACRRVECHARASLAHALAPANPPTGSPEPQTHGRRPCTRVDWRGQSVALH